MKNNNEVTTGDRIRLRRKALGLTLEQVASAVGVGYSTVRKWEVGLIANMKRDKMAALAQVLKLSPMELFELGNNNQETSIQSITARLQTDKRFLEIVEMLNNLDEEKLNGVQAMLALIK